MQHEADLVRIVGFADMCEAFSRAFSFPDKELAQALSDGSFLQDCLSCAADIGLDFPIEEQEALRELESLKGSSRDALFETLRIAYSQTYLNPGFPTIFPYESPFRHVADGREGVPSLFRTSVTLDVQRHMRDAGVIPEGARKVPCDGMDKELAFLSYAFGKLAQAFNDGDTPLADEWRARIVSFLREHADIWFVPFFSKTAECDVAATYRAVARLARAFSQELSHRWSNRRKEG